MNQDFSIIPSGSKPLWFFFIIFILLLAVILLIAIAGYSSQKANFQISDQGLKIQGDIYGRFIPQSKLLVDSAREINLNQETDYRPQWKVFGTGLPGYQAGWFNLKNGNRALVYLTDYQQAVLVPTTDNYVLLFSLQQPKLFLASLKQEQTNSQH